MYLREQKKEEIHAFGKEHLKYNDLAKMFAKEAGEPIYNIAMDHLNQNSNDILRPMIEEAIEKGELNKSFDITFIVNTLTYLFNSFEDIIGTSDDTNIMIERLDKFIEFMKYGFKNKQS